ncbi:MAG: hypothetical protein WC133_06405 [Candidatus Omnitrophota bacterium]
MDNFKRIGESISVRMVPDESGFTGRECPNSDCEGYFKIVFGTGLKGEKLPCHCPYCGHTEGHDHFWTKEQIEYAKSVAMRKMADALHQDLKKMEFDHKPKGAFGIGISLKVKPGCPVPIRYYREKRLETEVVCSNCTLRYSVYGVFAFCPDCGQHNSFQIFDKNFEVVDKMINLAADKEKEIAEKLIENSLEDCISAFDGFGRELCRICKEKAAGPTKVERVSFQNLESAKVTIFEMFGIDASAYLTSAEWQTAIRGFQKRHLIAHKMGVVDQSYITKTGDTQAVIGRRVRLEVVEVRELIPILKKFARCLYKDLQIHSQVDNEETGHNEQVH